MQIEECIMQFKWKYVHIHSERFERVDHLLIERIALFYAWNTPTAFRILYLYTVYQTENIILNLLPEKAFEGLQYKYLMWSLVVSCEFKVATLLWPIKSERDKQKPNIYSLIIHRVFMRIVASGFQLLCT